MSTLNWNVSGDPHGDQPVLIADNPPGGTTLATHFEGVLGQPPNRFIAVVPPSITGGATLYWNHGKNQTRVIVPPGDGSWEAGAPPCLPPELTPEDEALKYGPLAVFLEPLERRGQFYYLHGAPFTVIECSDFRLYERFLDGENIEPVLQDRKETGFNTLRVWLLNTSVGHIVPSEHPDFYAKLRPFLGLCGRFGLYVELTVFTQTQTLLPRLSDQQAHYDGVVTAIGDAFCFVEGVNEADSHDNAFDTALRLWKPSGATFDLCRGSNGSDAWALEPVIDSTRYHSNDAPEWQRRCAHNGMEMGDAFGRPNIANENTRPDHDPDTDHHHDAAAGAALLSAGSCFHDNSGKNSVVRAGLDLACANAWVAGARSVDLSQRTSGYVHRTDLEGPTVIRAYQRGSAIVLVRK